MNNQCENCGRWFFDLDEFAASMYCPECEDWFKWRAEEQVSEELQR